MTTQSQPKKQWWHTAAPPHRCYVLCRACCFDFRHVTNSSRASVCDPRSFAVLQLCCECQTPASSVAACPERRYHTAQSLTKSQPRAAGQTLIDRLILFFFCSPCLRASPSFYDLFWSVNYSFIIISSFKLSWFVVIWSVACRWYILWWPH